jgi:PKD repeat protein
LNSSRTLTHEAGHWLNLSHVWGGNNNPGNASSCSTDDGVSDTPTSIGSTSCTLNSNSCDQDNAYWNGKDMKDNVENFMDYSYCSKMFSKGQASRMRTALTSNNAGRNNLWTTDNLNETGALDKLYAASFYTDKTIVCVGDEIEFKDGSYNTVTGWTWEIVGATPSSSTDQNPVFVFNTPGVYTVKLTATDGTASLSETKTNYIQVLPAAITLPYLESFEGYTDLPSSGKWFTTNEDDNNTFELETTTALSGTKCVKLANFGQTGQNTDVLLSSAVDLTSLASTDQATLSFRYSYKKRTSSDQDRLKQMNGNLLLLRIGKLFT